MSRYASGVTAIDQEQRTWPVRRCGVVLALGFVGLLSILACDGGPPAIGVSVVDSLGVRIVEHGDIGFSGLPRWSLDPDPLVSIGVAEGEEAYQLFGVTDAHRRDDGTIAVLDRSRSLRLFDRLG
ncbi:MAG TPA: hypothetical protein VGA18_03690, partial [Rhodothermales bacterium]